MKIFLENREVEAKEGAKIADILLSQGINPEAVVVKRGKEVAADFEEARDGDRLELIRVVSGG
jgi:sulfur carrier protein ThiS